MAVLEEQLSPENSSATFDEASLDRSKSFVNALQELKDLRSQLYSAADYCEKSYVQSDQKQMVLDNIKDYTVRALVNAVDHLGTVAYKLTDLLDQQSLDISNMDLKVSCLNQQLVTCKTFTEKEGLRQQQLLAVMPRNHKHYILPNSANKKVHFSPHIITDPSQQFPVKSIVLPSGTPAPKALTWHLASETNSTLKASALALLRPGDPYVHGRTTVKNNIPTLEPADGMRTKNSTTPPKLPRVGPASSAAIQTLGVLKQDGNHVGELTAFGSFGNESKSSGQQRISPGRSKSMLSTFFVKYKTMKVRSGALVRYHRLDDVQTTTPRSKRLSSEIDNS